jgi:hypothetical protein
MYTLVPAEVLLSAEQRLQIVRSVFAPGAQERDLEAVVSSRWRSADILYYKRFEESVQLTPAPGDTHLLNIQYDRNVPIARVYRRLHALYVPPLQRLVTLVLDLVPVSERRQEGQVDVHAFSTFAEIVKKPHKDGSGTAPVEWVVAYVVAKQGGGACSVLSEDEEQRQVVARVDIGVGQALMHRDDRFFHDVTRLERTADCPQPRRDVIVITIRPKI